MEIKEQLYEGKAKKVFATDDPDLCVVSYKDDATALFTTFFRPMLFCSYQYLLSPSIAICEEI